MTETAADHLTESIELLIEDLDEMLHGRGPIAELHAKIRRAQADLRAMADDVTAWAFESTPPKSPERTATCPEPSLFP